MNFARCPAGFTPLVIEGRAKITRSISYCRPNHSSGPVRYTPKHSGSSENQTAPPIKNPAEKDVHFSLDSSLVEKTCYQNGGVTYRSSKLNESFQNQTFKAFHYPKASLEAGFELDETKQDLEYVNLGLMDEYPEHGDEIQRPLKEACAVNAKQSLKTKQEAENVAIEALAARAFTTLDLRKKLCGKKFPVEIVDSVIANLQGRGLLNDYLYAESFTRSRWHTLCWGPRRIKQALRLKGVSETAAEKAMKEVFEDSKCDPVLQLGMSKDSLDLLVNQAMKQWVRSKDASLETRKSRIVRWLQYRGFNWGTTSFVLKKLESEHPPLACSSEQKSEGFADSDGSIGN